MTTTSYLFNSLTWNLSKIAGTNEGYALAHFNNATERYEATFHTKTRKVTTYLIRLALEQMRKGDTTSANHTASKVAHEIMHNNYILNPFFEWTFKYDFTKDKIAFDTIEYFAQIVDYLQTVEEKMNHFKNEFWETIANLYSIIAKCLKKIYSEGFYNTSEEIEKVLNMFNQFTTTEQVRDLNLLISGSERNVTRSQNEGTPVSENPFDDLPF